MQEVEENNSRLGIPMKMFINRAGGKEKT